MQLHTNALVQSRTKAYDIVADTWTTIMGNPNSPLPKIIFSNIDKYRSASAGYSYCKESDEFIFSELRFPRKDWKNVPVNFLRVQVPLEMVNYFFFDKISEMEKAMADEIRKAEKKYAKNHRKLKIKINETTKYYEKLGVNEIQLSRKLIGDESVYAWMLNANYDPMWLINYLDKLKKESSERTNYNSIKKRVQGLNLRIRHIKLLIKGETKKAKQIRDKQSYIAKERLAAFTPSTVQ